MRPGLNWSNRWKTGWLKESQKCDKSMFYWHIFPQPLQVRQGVQRFHRREPFKIVGMTFYSDSQLLSSRNQTQILQICIISVTERRQSPQWLAGFVTAYSTRGQHSFLPRWPWAGREPSLQPSG